MALKAGDFEAAYESAMTVYEIGHPWTLPEAPRAPEATSGTGYIEVAWGEPVNMGGFPVKEYIVYRGEGDGPLEEIGRVDHPLTQYVDMDVEPGVTYRYMVTAVTERAEGHASDITVGLAFGPPGPPRDLEALAGDGVVTLTWSAPEDDGGREVWGYRVYRGLSSDPDGMVMIRDYTTPTFSHRDGSVVNDQDYWYAVAAYNSAGLGERASVGPARPVRPITAPGLVQGLRCPVDGTTVTLSWGLPLDLGGGSIVGYRVEMGTSLSAMEVVSGDITVRSFTVEDLERGQDYWFSVAALNEEHQGEFCRPVQATIEPLKEPVEDDSSWLYLVLIACACLVTVGAIASTESGRYRWALMLGPLTTRLRREEVLDNQLRYSINGLIMENPGIHYNAIMREFGLKNGVAAYHLQVLEREDFIRSVSDGRLKRFYSRDTKVPRDQRLTPDGIKEAVMELVSARPGISQKEMMNELGLDRGTLRYHLGVLDEEGALRTVHEGNRATYYSRRST
jgi:fibronectin type 3 domain-containing protein/DNA-binding transcriptional ArsR family regulator